MTGFLALLGIWLVALNGDAVRRVLGRSRAAELEPAKDILGEGAADYEHAA